ncbi:MAG: M20/M25/M40 family metallo-hydrolase [Chloroflexi bacterium]|nr:M20/M25/M40 family metallo-hydrolase [Chloroflexota bacterium]MBP8059835.1 M20/M25/M40 family metallo-hydrolase [Chloroflexota bacterium]
MATIDATAVKTYLETNLLGYLDWLRRMVEINSFTENPAGVDALGDLTAELFAPLGFTAERIRSAIPRYGHHLVMTRWGRHGQQGRTIGLISHLDTVFPPAEEITNNFHWRIEGERIYGPGTNDIKGGTLIMYMILDALRTFAPSALDTVNWVLLLDASEEQDADDFGRLCLERLEPSQPLGALIFEAGYVNNHVFNLVAARKGMAQYAVTVEGKGAHAGAAHDAGINAIVQLADTVQKIAMLTDYGRGVTFNVGSIQGGTVTNRVPHYAEARGEMRAFDAAAYQEKLSALLALPNEVVVQNGNGQGAKVQITVERKTQPWPRNPQTDRLIEIWSAAASQLGWQIKPEYRGGLSDGNHIYHRIPTLDGLGPAGMNAHCSERSADGSKDQEYVLVSSFVPKTLLNTLAILQLIEESRE